MPPYLLRVAILIVTLGHTLSTTINAVTETLYVQDPELSSDKSKACNYKQYVSLGDSYPAGVYAFPGEDLPICKNNPPDLDCSAEKCCSTKKCLKNIGAYGYQFYDKHQPKHFTFLACSSANTTGCLNSQVPNIPKDADLITINIGGDNGEAFAWVVGACVYLYSSIGCDDAIKYAGKVVAGIEPTLVNLFESIGTRAPKAKDIVVLSYIRFWPETTKPDPCHGIRWLENPSAAQRSQINTLVKAMNSALSTAARSNKFKHKYKFVDVDVDDSNKWFTGHRLCNDISYFQWNLVTLYEHGAFHPNGQGHQRYAMALEQALGCSLRPGRDELGGTSTISTVVGG
ncbi:hypothetical protein MMC10_002430 [Thelotrema lepadinum]|nr:hypothetical protein [Thelotrema lepadinum]